MNNTYITIGTHVNGHGAIYFSMAGQASIVCCTAVMTHHDMGTFSSLVGPGMETDRSPVDSPRKGPVMLMLALLLAGTNCWTNMSFSFATGLCVTRIYLSQVIYVTASSYWNISHDDVINWKHFPCWWPFVKDPPVTGGFPSQRPVTRSFVVFFISSWTNISNFYTLVAIRLLMQI